MRSLTENDNLKFQKLSAEEKEKRGILGRLYGPCCDVINATRNGRKYSEELWNKVFNSDIIKEQFDAGGIFGELTHPDYEEVAIDKIAVVMPEPPVKNKDGLLVGYWDILDTPCGRILKTLCDYGYKMGISTRGSGDLITDFNGNESVDPDTYNLNALDIVLVPAVKAARLQYVTESLDKKRYNKTLRDKLTESISKETEENQKIMTESLNNLGIILEESLSPATPYMLRNDGECLSCGKLHPYIQSDINDSLEKNLKHLFSDLYSFSINWFYENTNQEETRDYLKSFIKSIVSCPETVQYKEIVDDIISFDYDTYSFTDDLTELKSIYNFLNAQTNQEFCRVRTSHMTFGGTSGDTYFRISSVGFNWFDIIYKLVANNNKFITSVTICKDSASLGGRNDFYQYKGQEFKFMPTNEFLTLSGNPIVEQLDAKCELDDQAIQVLASGGNLSEAYINMHPRNAMPYFRRLSESYVNNHFNSAKTLDEGLDTYECPVCGRRSVKYEFIPSEHGVQCPKCNSELIKTDNGKYTEYNESLAEELEQLGFEDLSEAAYTKDELIDKFGTDDLDIINAGNEEDVQLKSDIEEELEQLGYENDSKLVEYLATPKQNIKLETRPFNYELYYGDKKSSVNSAVVVIPDAISLPNGDTMDAAVNCRDGVIGNPTINFRSEEEAQKWIDTYGDNLTWSVHSNSLYATPNIVDEDSARRFAKESGFRYSDIEPWQEDELDESLYEELEQLGYETTFDESQVEDNNEVNNIAVDDDKAVVEELQEALSLNRKLDGQIVSLKERLSVSYAKESELLEEINSLKDKVNTLSKATANMKQLNGKITTLEESLKQKDAENEKSKVQFKESLDKKKEFNNRLSENLEKKDSKINMLLEKLDTSRSENKKLSDECDKLAGQVETYQKDFKQLKEQYSKKVTKQNALIEKYQKIALNSINKYIDSQATRLGIKSEEIKNRLPESYGFKDIDKVCEDLQEYKLNVNLLPFNTNSVLNENIKISAKNVKNDFISNPDDDVTDYDLRIAGLI